MQKLSLSLSVSIHILLFGFDDLWVISPNVPLVFWLLRERFKFKEKGICGARTFLMTNTTLYRGGFLADVISQVPFYLDFDRRLESTCSMRV
jgi:hypothetical protein